MVFTGRTEEGKRRVVRVNGNVLALPALGRGEARHSPDGFNWGYGGSGPAELARAILVAVLPGDRAVRRPACYQRFNTAVISALGESWALTEQDVLTWVESWRASEPGREVEEFLRVTDRLGPGSEEARAEWEGGG